jgi:Tfp pilus assembly protein PilN
MEKKNYLLIAIAIVILCAGYSLGHILATPTDMEILDQAANMPAERLKAAARTTTSEIKEANATADHLNARKTVILAVQDANQ